MVSNQEPLSYRNEMNLGLISKGDGARSSVIRSYFKVNKFGKCKLDNEHHYGSRYLSLPNLMGNALDLVQPKTSTFSTRALI